MKTIVCSDLGTNSPKLRAQFSVVVFFLNSAYKQGHWATVTGSHCAFLRCICLVLCCVAVAKLKTCPLEFSSLKYELWQDWQAAAPSRVLNNKTFLYHVFLCKYKKAPLHLSTWLFSSVFPPEWRLVVLLSHMELWEVLRYMGQRRPTILPRLPHAFGPWSGQSGSLSLY